MDECLNREAFSRDHLNLPDEPTFKEYEKIQKSIENRSTAS